MTSDPTGIQPFDPESGTVPPGLVELSGTVEGRLVVLAVTPDADPEWAARSGVELARSWAGRVSRLFVMDLGLAGPSLHRPLDLPNEEGTADIFLYGSSVQRVARPADGGAFYFASAGTPTADPETVLTHERWPALLKGFRDASATVALFLPLQTPGASSVLERADLVLLLGADDGAGVEAVAGGGVQVEAVVTPPPAAPAEIEEEPPEEVVAEDVAGEAPGGAEEAGAAVDIGELAPEDEPGEVVDIGELAPETEPGEVVDIDDLAPEEEPAAVAGAEEPAPEETEVPVMDVGELAPDEEPAEDVEEAMEEAASAADVEWEAEPTLDEAEEPLEAEEEELAGVEAELEEDEVHEAEEELEFEEPFEGSGSAEEEEEVEEGGEELDFGEPFEPAGAMEEEDEPEEELDFDEPAGPDESAENRVEEAEEEEEVGGFDLGSFDTLAGADEEDEAGEEGEEEIQIRSDFGEDQEEEQEGEPSAEDEGDLELAGPADEALAAGDEGDDEAAPGPEDGDEFDFGGFSGEVELDEEEEEVEEDEEVEAVGVGPDADDAPAGPAEEPEPDFGDDLVTGPDFGQGATDEWDDSSGDSEEGEGDVPHPSEAGVGEGLEAETRGPSGADERGEPGAEEEGAAEEDEEGAAPERPSPAPSRSIVGRLVRLLAVAVVFAGAALAAHWFGVVQIPGADALIARVLGPAATGSVPEVVTTDPQPETPVLGYSLALDALRDQGAATEVADAWQESYDDFLFVVAPVQVDGEIFYRLFAGPARSSGEAEELRSALSEILTREDPSSWVVRPTPLAFLISEHDSRGAATGRVVELTGAEIPAYVLRVTYPGDTVRYRVYVGAYESGEEARAMDGILSAAGYDDARFTERRGTLPE